MNIEKEMEKMGQLDYVPRHKNNVKYTWMA